jgi:sugar phosphate isomerase/epimerase
MFSDHDALDRATATIERIAGQLRAHGMTLGYHSHTWELATKIDGEPALLRLFERLAPEVFAEIDVYWAQVAGVDPAALVAGLGARAQLVHMKDGPARDRTDTMVAIGTGAVDVPTVVQAGSEVRWHLVELDRCDGDVYAVLDRSRRFLAGLGLT